MKFIILSFLLVASLVSAPTATAEWQILAGSNGGGSGADMRQRFAQASTTLAPNTGAVVTLPAVTPAPGATVKISGGTIAGDILEWAVLVFGGTLASFAVLWFRAGLKKLGVETTAADNARLEEILKNGMAHGAHTLATKIDGSLEMESKNKIINLAIGYAKDHGAGEFKRLGVDPNDPKAIEAMQARLAKLLDEKASPAVVLGDKA